jgi:hypothetical protein
MRGSRIPLLALSLALPLAFVPRGGEAESIQGAKRALCSLVENFECNASGRCQEVTPDDLDLPQFFTVDFGKKRISGITAQGVERVTSIENDRSVDGGRRILQGSENGRGWSVLLDPPVGKLTLAATDFEAGTGFLLFGACTPLD